MICGSHLEREAEKDRKTDCRGDSAVVCYLFPLCPVCAVPAHSWLEGFVCQGGQGQLGLSGRENRVLELRAHDYRN